MTLMKHTRLERGLSQQVLGTRTRIQAGDISRIERRILVPSSHQRSRIAKALKVEEAALLMEVEAYEPATP